MRIFREITNDRGLPVKYAASNNDAEYRLYSAYAHDLLKEYIDRYERIPSSRWYRRHFQFESVRFTR